MKIVTWNIAALPTLVNSYGNPHFRIKDIIRYLKSLNADIILLQEVFLKKIVYKIKKSLEKKYDIFLDRSCPKGKFICSGLLILVLKKKMKIRNVCFYPYKKASGEDKYANKGFLVLDCDNLKIINTHLNANAIFSTKNRCIRARNKQIGEVYHYYKNCDKTCVLGGDFNMKNLSFDRCVNENIDYIFYNGDQKLKKKVILTHASDHPILICDVNCFKS